MRRQQLMDFSDALCLLKEGKRVIRLDLEDTFEYIHLIDDAFYAKSAVTGKTYKWIVNQDDLLEEDWIAIHSEEEEGD